MKTSHQRKNTGRFACILVWTIRNQDFLAHHIRFYTYSAVAIILLLTLSMTISLEMALFALLICGLILGFGLWVAIERRRSWLLSISDPQLKKEVHQAMLSYLAQKTRDPKMLHTSLFQMEENQNEQNKMKQKKEYLIH